ncbi:MAG: branched-chain amino acid ABC transporter substrate-binding protein [Solirubrobacteraceae bacterium]
MLLVLIGPDWLTSRLDSELDYVRLEIATALSDDTPIVPLRIRGARMPSAEELPSELVRLVDLNATQLSGGMHWRDDVNRLITTIETILTTTTPPRRRRPTPPPWWRAILAGVWSSVARSPYTAAVAVAAVAAAAIIVIIAGRGDQPLRIYSGLPQREQRQPASVAADGSGHNPNVVTDQRISEMESAMRLALEKAGGKAGRFDVTYEALDDSDASGESPAAIVQANAKRAADDGATAVYIGDFNSDDTQESIPILSRAKIPQISPASTQVGLTAPDRRGDVDEPGRYYPEGYHNFVRIIPNNKVIARAVVAIMAQTDDCERVAMVNDNAPYGEALANNILASNQGRMRFVFNESVGPFGRYQHLVDRVHALSPQPDCFVYSGIRNPNTVEIFENFARALPTAELYGTGVSTASFYDPQQGGLSQRVAERVKVMVPPRDNARSDGFVDDFNKAYGKDPGPYAAYAYEAMRLALDAIARSKTGKRDDIRNALFSTADQRKSMLGLYSITPTGDTTLATFGVSRIKNGRLTPPETAPRLLPR